MAEEEFMDEAMDEDLGGDLLGNMDLAEEVAASTPSTTSGLSAELDADGIPKNLELLMDVPLDVSVRLGQIQMQVRELLKLNKGSLIELEKEADDPLEIHVNNRLMAYGEVVMIKDKLGIRITDIVSLNERLENLRG
ncbi:MAG: flagellar motor switch protein FliN [Magnetococcales bacterium]|nr:flagellar motor switch protein FliN [Magnetococcales bacterium]